MTNKTPADNERFHASGGIRPLKHLWEFGSASPARTFVKPPPAWSRHHVMCKRGTTQRDNETENLTLEQNETEKFFDKKENAKF